MKDIRDYLNIISENKENKSYEFINDLLFESQNYKNMFNSLLKYIKDNDYDVDLGSINTFIKDEIKRAKTFFKRHDRIIWALRHTRLYLAYITFKSSKIVHELYNKDYDNFKNELMVRYFEHNDYNSAKLVYNEIYDGMIHFLSLPITKIQNFVFELQTDDEIWSLFEEYEKEWKQNRKGKIPLNDDHDYRIIKEFPNNWYWVLLNRHYCELEADAMGHCGNRPGHVSDRILSLRKLIKVGDDKFWEPHLTFILDKDGFLGEMKGRGNEKPAAKYHPYIIELLKMPIIKGISGGGYLPEKNFSLDDLPKNNYDELIQKKPGLGTFLEQYEYNGNKISDDLLFSINTIFKNKGININAKLDNNGYVIVNKFNTSLIFFTEYHAFYDFYSYIKRSYKNPFILPAGEKARPYIIELLKILPTDILNIYKNKLNYTNQILQNDYGSVLEFEHFLRNASYKSKLEYNPYTVLENSVLYGFKVNKDNNIKTCLKIINDRIKNATIRYSDNIYPMRIVDENDNIFEFTEEKILSDNYKIYIKIPEYIFVKLHDVLHDINRIHPATYFAMYIAWSRHPSPRNDITSYVNFDHDASVSYVKERLNKIDFNSLLK